MTFLLVAPQRRYLKVLLLILTTRPITTATNERSFSALKYLKTYLWSIIKVACLNEFALGYVTMTSILNFEDVVDEFLRKNRRLNFK